MDVQAYASIQSLKLLYCTLAAAAEQWYCMCYFWWSYTILRGGGRGLWKNPL